jgi:hypothetical protein
MAGGPMQPLREPVFVGVHLAFGISLLIWHLLLRQLAGLGLVQAQMATAKKTFVAARGAPRYNP